MEQFVTRHDLDGIAHIADTDGEIWQLFGVAAQPAWVFVDGETGDIERVLGALSTGDLEQRVDALAG